jgi:hypothetical protein
VSGFASRATTHECAPRTKVTQSVFGLFHSTYALGEVVVAEVRGDSVRLLDGDGVADQFTCATPEVAHEQAVRYAWALDDVVAPGSRQ